MGHVRCLEGAGRKGGATALALGHGEAYTGAIEVGHDGVVEARHTMPKGQVGQRGKWVNTITIGRRRQVVATEGKHALRGGSEDGTGRAQQQGGNKQRGEAVR